MRNSILFSILLITLSLSCSEEEILCPTLPIEEGTITNLDEYSIIEAVVTTQFKDEGFIHISQGPLLNSHSEFLQIQLDNKSGIQFDSSAIEQYHILNNTDFIWGDQIPGSRELINKEEVLCQFEPGNKGWTDYYNKYENSAGILFFARPYINEEGEAFLEFEKHSYWLDAYGFIAILKKEGQFWVVRKIINTWIS